MSWELTIKATTSKSAKLVWPSMKKLIDKFFETNQEYIVINLRNFLIDNLDAQIREDNPDMTKAQQSAIIGAGLRDLKDITSGRSKYMDQKVPRYIRSHHKKARTSLSGGQGETYKPIKKSWDSTLKQARSKNRKLVEETIKAMIADYVVGKDEFSSDELKQYIIDNLRDEHIKRHSVDGKISGPISGAPKRYINHLLDGAMKTKIPKWVKSHGLTNVNLRRRDLGGDKPSTIFKKSDSWESMVDSMIAEDKLFEEIYTAILRKFKFSSPSKEKVVAYLNANYKKHPLFNNKWSIKSGGEGQ